MMRRLVFEVQVHTYIQNGGVLNKVRIDPTAVQ